MTNMVHSEVHSSALVDCPRQYSDPVDFSTLQLLFSPPVADLCSYCGSWEYYPCPKLNIHLLSYNSPPHSTIWKPGIQSSRTYWALGSLPLPNIGEPLQQNPLPHQPFHFLPVRLGLWGISFNSKISSSTRSFHCHSSSWVLSLYAKLRPKTHRQPVERNVCFHTGAGQYCPRLLRRKRWPGESRSPIRLVYPNP